MEQIVRLTDRTINEVYFHARTAEGAISVPVSPIEAAEEPETEAKVLADLEFLRMSGLISEANFKDCVEQARKKFSEPTA